MAHNGVESIDVNGHEVTNSQNLTLITAYNNLAVKAIQLQHTIAIQSFSHQSPGPKHSQYQL